jgi:hypothetical protein
MGGSSSRIAASWAAAALTTGCSLLPLFDESPGACGTVGLQRTRSNACGVCGDGTLTEACGADGRWAPVPGGCEDDHDGDGDGWEHPACLASPGGCCGDRIDCNDGRGDVHPDEYECVAGGDGDCTTTCGSEGSRECSAECVWSACAPPAAETCNGTDDDCDGETDESFACPAGAEEGCTTACGGAGSRACPADCFAWGACLGDEACNGCDDDGDGDTDEAWACVRDATEACDAGGCEGIRTCDAGCAWGACERVFAEPAPPELVAPAPGAVTGSRLLPASRRPLQPEFRWRPSTGCPAGDIRYQLQIDDSCAGLLLGACEFPSPEIDRSGLAETRFRPATPLAISVSPPMGRRYAWRVRACYDGGACGMWSRPRSVAVGVAPGDVNGDGYSDFVVGAPGPLPSGPGYAVLFFGSPAFDGSLRTRLAVTDSRRFGISAALVGDVNGDRFADVVVASEGDPGAHLFLGGDVIDGTADDDIVGRVSVVAAAGDANGDGFGDVAVFAATGGALLRGRSSGLDTARLGLVLTGTAPFAAAAGGDADGDGLADLWAGMPDPGVVALYGGSEDWTTPRVAAFSRTGPAADALGAAVAGLPDLDGDDRPELLVGSPQNGAGAPSGPGRAALFFSRAPPIDTPDREWSGVATGDLLGIAVASVGDVNGDGVPDLAAGAQRADHDTNGGAVLLVWDIDDPAGRAWLAGRNDRQTFGAALAPAGDIDADGYDDFVVGAPNDDAAGAGAGRAYLLRGAASLPTPPTHGVELAPGVTAADRFGTVVAGGHP